MDESNKLEYDIEYYILGCSISKMEYEILYMSVCIFSIERYQDFFLRCRFNREAKSGWIGEIGICNKRI